MVRNRAVLLVILGLAGACSAPSDEAGSNADTRAETESAAADTAFAGLQERGKSVMGVDQYTSSHEFDDLPDGGRIELQRDSADADDIATIRAHMKEVAAAFERGDFKMPAMVHMETVPGTKVMAEKRDVIRYVYSDLERGGEVRIITTDPEALKAVHEFMAFQRMDHRAMGHSMD